MLAAVLRSPRNLSIEKIPMPQVVPRNYVKIAIKSVGLCGSDLHYYEKGRIGNFELTSPMVLGHEAAGVVDEAGEETSFKKGDIVAIEPGVPCGSCRFCISDQYNLCPYVKFFATPPIDGALQEYVIHPAEFVYLAKDLTTSEACLAEPLSVGIYASAKTEIIEGERVLIIGAGPIGLLAAFAVQARGATVTLLEISKQRIQLAKEAGFEAFESTDGLQANFDVVFECTGTKGGIRDSQILSRPGGRVALIGMGTHETMQLDGLAINTRGLQIQGIFRYANTYKEAIELITKFKNQLEIFQGFHINLQDLPQVLFQKSYLNHLKTIIDLP